MKPAPGEGKTYCGLEIKPPQIFVSNKTGGRKGPGEQQL